MVQSRFSWGYEKYLMLHKSYLITCVILRYFGAVIPSVFNVFTSQGFLILNCIIGGQTLASVSPRLDDTLGIVIISLISLVVSLFPSVIEPT
jgi:purine-cytosine permease-like protein